MFQLISNLPPFFGMQYTQEGGALTTNALLYNDQQWQTLNQLLITLNQMTNQGMQFPQFTTAQIAAFGVDASVPSGTVWFDTTISKLKVKTAPLTIEEITST